MFKIKIMLADNISWAKLVKYQQLLPSIYEQIFKN